MSFSEYGNYDALGLAELVAKREVTPLELAEEALARIARVDGTLHATTARYDELAREQARGELPAGPFRGVPFALKNLLAEARGTAITSGSRLMAAYVSDHDSELVARYRAAGLVIVARTASPELGLTPVTEPDDGPTGTPWDSTRSSGGSSGGSAALVGAGALPMANGGDGGGSLRIPASCCGVFGFKPTRGRTPAGPDTSEHWLGLAIQHAITRSVRDSAALLDATCAPEPSAPYHAPARERPFLTEVGTKPGKLTIALSVSPALPSQVQPEAIAAAHDAAALCRELGHEVVEASPSIDPMLFAKALLPVIAAETAATVHELEQLRGRRRKHGELQHTTELVAMYARALSAADLSIAIRQLRGYGRLMADFHRKYDLLLTPTTASVPPLHNALKSTGAQLIAERALARAGVPSLMKAPGLIDALASKVYDFIPWTPLANVTGAPSMSVPLWWSADQLPLGAMFTARFGDDATLFRLAGQLEAARPWAKRRPPVHAFDA